MTTSETTSTPITDDHDHDRILPPAASPGEVGGQGQGRGQGRGQEQETEEAEEQEPELVVRKGRGRPRVDGTPGKLDTKIPIPTPSPQYKKYWSGATNRSQYPTQLIKWYHELPQWAKDRMIVYVERDWPVLVKITKEDKAKAKAEGRSVGYNYIDKLAEMPKDTAELRDKYGSGDYHLSLNDAVAGVTLAQAWVKENWRDIQQFPPADQRIQKVENVDLNDPGNRSYVEYLRGRGKLPEQNQGGQGVAEATAISAGIAGQSMAMADKLINRLMDAKDRDKGNNDTTATVVKEVMEVMGSVTEKASDVMKSAYEQTANRTSPMDSLKEVAAVFKELKGGPGDGQGAEATTMMMAMMREMREASAANTKMMMEMQSKQIERLERQLERQAEVKTAPVAGADGTGAVPVSQVSSLVTGVDQIVSVVQKLGFSKAGVTDGGAGVGGGGMRCRRYFSRPRGSLGMRPRCGLPRCRWMRGRRPGGWRWRRGSRL